MKKITLIIAASVLILLLSLSVLSGCDSPCPELDGKAPDFSLLDLSNKKITLSELKGKTVILNFWAISCVYCKYELPFFQTAHDEFSKKSHVFLMINSMENAGTVSSFITENKYTFPVLIDKDSKVTAQYCFRALPGTVIIDPRGIILYGKLGAFRTADELMSVIEAY